MPKEKTEEKIEPVPTPLAFFQDPVQTAQQYEVPQSERNDIYMSCKSAIMTSNTVSTPVAVNSVIPIGNIIRRFGNSVSAAGNAIFLNDRGYYNIDITATFTAPVAGNATITIFQNGVAIPGATATVTVTTANTQFVTVSIPAIARVFDSCSANSITLVLTGIEATFTNVGVVVEKM